MKKLSQLIVLSSFSSALFAAELDSKVDIQSGYNNNPYRFNDQFTIEGAGFMRVKAQTELKVLKPWSISAALKHHGYEDTATAANKTEWQLASELRFGKASDHWGASMSFNHLDKTYISRLNGGPSTYQGQSLDDRYDYYQSSLELFSKDKINKSLSNRISLSYDLKDYQDFDNISISDLDYQAITVDERFDIITNKHHRNRFSLAFTLRDYLNREQKDANGNSINGSQLQYHYTFAGYEYRYKANKRFKTQLAFDWENRIDNGSGYYDSNAVTANLALDFSWNKHHNSKMSLKWRDFAYQRDIELTSAGDEEEFNSETRLQMRLNHNIAWPALLGPQGEVQLGYQFKSADANRSAYQYQQQIIHGGIKLNF